ncbi:MAG: acyltransferase family protein [Betaproteobacteria bacterium]
MDNRRIDWIDHVRGLCILLVVMLYATGWIADATGREGWLHRVVDFAAPFRMPALLFVSGLLLAKTIGDPWRRYLDRKVAHFAYFYLLWLTVAFALTGAGMARTRGWSGVGEFYLHSLVHPYSWLWFIYVLPFMFVAARLLRRLPAPLVWAAAAALHLAGIDSGVKVWDKFAHYYVFFFSGYALAPLAFRLADAAAARPGLTMAALLPWAALQAGAASLGLAELRLPSFAFAYAGIAALTAGGALMAKHRWSEPLRYCGANSLVIYAAFFAPALAARAVLSRQALVTDGGTLALAVTAAGVLGALALHWTVRGTRLRFLFERPAWLRAGAPRVAWRKIAG